MHNTEAAAVFIVNEITVWRLAWRVLVRRPTQILFVEPLFPPLGSLLGRASKWLCGHGAGSVVDDFPEDREMWNYPNRIFAHDVLSIVAMR